MPRYFCEANKENGILSNYWIIPNGITYQGRTFKSSEHLYHWLKFFHDGASPAEKKYAEAIRAQTTPYKAHILGSMKPRTQYEWQKPLNKLICEAHAQGVRPRVDLDNVRDELMIIANKAKYRQSKEARDFLFSTNDEELSERSTHPYWARTKDGQHGADRLGRLLMELRSDLRQEFEV